MSSIFFPQHVSHLFYRLYTCIITKPFFCFYDIGYHECEIFEGHLEAEESAAAWNNCYKNPRHKQFIPVQDFKDIHLPRSLDDEVREWLRLSVDLTLRIKIQWTSRDRPDNDALSEYRGTGRLRLGTGFITHISGPFINVPCPCPHCLGKIPVSNISNKHWEFSVRTAKHVVYNDEEAERTIVDLFYDDENSRGDGRMATARAVKVVRATDLDRDHCRIRCVTHDEALFERLQSIFRRWLSLFFSYKHSLWIPKPISRLDRLRRLFACERIVQILIVSHPHGQPKKITVGKAKKKVWGFDNHYCVEYHTATCPGSSGAPIFPVDTLPKDSLSVVGYFWVRLVHSGTNSRTSSIFKDQVNYANFWAN